MCPLLPLTLVLLLTACSGVEFRRGLPVLLKPTTGSSISGTEGRPDIDRGNQARLAGRHADAAKDLLPLAERGYTEAMLLLAASQAAVGTPPSRVVALRWYREALKTRPETAVPLVRTLIASGRNADIADAERLLRGLIERGDDTAAEITLLRLYRSYPANDPNSTAPALFAKAARSSDLALRLTAVDYARERVVDQASSQRLQNLCRENIAISPGCHVDLARSNRLSGDRKALEQRVNAALLAFAKLGSSGRPPQVAELPPINIALLAGRLANTLVALPDDEDLALLSEQMRNTQRAEARLQQGIADMASPSNQDPVQVVQLGGGAGPEILDAAVAQATGPDAEPELANRVLRWMLQRDGDMAMEAAGVAVASPYLLTGVDLEAILSKAHAEGRPRAALMLGELYFFAQRVPRNPQRAESFFKLARQHPTTAVTAHYRLGRLYQSGHLGRPEPQLALSNFLYAARRQMVAADRQLARMFYDTPGVRTDRINAYVFARLADEAGFPVFIRSLRGGTLASYPLLDRLVADLTAGELQRAKGLYAQERLVHPVTPRLRPSQPAVAEPATSDALNASADRSAITGVSP